VVEPDIGSFPETIQRTGGGVLYAPNTVEKLVEVIEPLLLDPDRARQLGAEGRAGVLKAFDIEQTARAMAGIYEQIARK
jgi:glycosyltransferase involved in cell wall biosynthesis